MVPKPTWRLKSNSSQNAVGVLSGQSLPAPSANDELEAPSAQQLPVGVAQSQYRQQLPQRAASSAHTQTQTQGYLDPSGPPLSPPGVDSRHGSQVSSSLPPAYPQEPKKQSRLSRLAANLTGHKDDDGAKQANKRRSSVRKSDNKPHDSQSHEASRINAAQQLSHHRQSSQHQLSTSVEQQDEDKNPGLDPYLQQGPDTPQVPPKDSQYLQHQQHQQHQQQRQQQFAHNPHVEQYNRPPLDRVSTAGSYQKQGGVDHYSPDKHQGSQQQPQQSGQPQYQTCQNSAQHPQNPNEYQAFNPQSAPSPLLGDPQLHAQDAAQQQRNYYQYQQQQPSNQSQGPSPQDSQPPSIHYLQQQQQQQQQQNQQQQNQQQQNQQQQNQQQQNQQQHFASQSQPHQSQEFQHQQQSSPSRAASLHQPELHHPQATRQVPQIFQPGQPLDTQQLPQRRPLSSQQPVPPSPLHSQVYSSQDVQQSNQSLLLDSPASRTTPSQQAQDSMAPSSQSNGRIRKVNEGGQQQSAASSRDSSLLQQPSAQASQGQPSRGDKQGQQTQGGEMSQSTPPSRASVADMSDEELEKMMKEHEVLREKYQKVKRYFFEQQSQVHQLQNTLANQRLSLSRTSWDDSEYGTRFNRLDGLIAQLSFSIRKDWKSIPPWLQIVVNKTAVETGKQEMTAVGRAFLSHWLVENIFDKYFHPDLEPGLSTQLQTIQLNIRKFAPPCHSSEDEDSLAAKVINWRLATLEGLSDLLRAPQAAVYRQKLTDTLNEKLIASLQMFLNDPAPPDIAGGVPMIVELAISVAQHLPLESREVHIEYFPPGHGIVPDLMKIESGIPALTSPIVELDEADRASLKSVASKMDDSPSAAEQELQNQQSMQPAKEDKKRSMFGFGGSKKPTTTPAALGKRESSLGQTGSQQSLTPAPPGSSSGPKDEPPARVRLSVGVAVQIRGKAVLMKAPVHV